MIKTDEKGFPNEKEREDMAKKLEEAIMEGMTDSMVIKAIIPFPEIMDKGLHVGVSLETTGKFSKNPDKDIVKKAHMAAALSFLSCCMADNRFDLDDVIELYEKIMLVLSKGDKDLTIKLSMYLVQKLTLDRVVKLPRGDLGQKPTGVVN